MCRDIGSSEFDYAAPVAILIWASVSISVKIIILKIATFWAHILKCVEGNAFFHKNIEVLTKTKYSGI